MNHRFRFVLLCVMLMTCVVTLTGCCGPCDVFSGLCGGGLEIGGKSAFTWIGIGGGILIMLLFVLGKVRRVNIKQNAKVAKYEAGQNQKLARIGLESRNLDKVPMTREKTLKQFNDKK